MIRGNPLTAGEIDKVHDEAFVSVAERLTEPPALDRLAGDAVRFEIVGAGIPATELIVVDLLVPPGPVAVSMNVYATEAPVVAPGRFTDVEVRPAVHGAVAGNPVILGETDHVHDEAFVSVAERLTEPPALDRLAGDAVRFEIVGATRRDA